MSAVAHRQIEEEEIVDLLGLDEEELEQFFDDLRENQVWLPVQVLRDAGARFARAVSNLWLGIALELER